MSDPQDFFSDKQFEIEHALSMFAEGFALLPARDLYSKEAIKSIGSIADRCHIYIVGLVPTVELIDSEQNGRDLILVFEALDAKYPVRIPLPAGLNLFREENQWFLADCAGKRYGPNGLQMMVALRDQSDLMEFKVQYIGQAFGRKKNRTAIDRLKKHETLQKISLLGVPNGYRLELILIELQENNRMITMINPFAAERDNTDARIKQGTSKLFGTSEAERVSLYEASMIRYFQPRFNMEFKDSFPSTNMKTLEDCYEKDLSAVTAEICIDSLPYLLSSDIIKQKLYHIVTHNLHEEEQRRAFFSISKTN